MDLKQIEYFVRVAELGSFTRASAALRIAQPALSRQVRLLELEFEQALLLRNGRGVTTTDAGKMLLEYGRGILHQIARMREEMGRARGALVGQVALGLPPSLVKVLAAPVVREFKSRLPAATLSIHEGLTAGMQESLISGRLDVALLYNASPSPDLDLEPLVEEELFLISPAGKNKLTSPVSMRDLADYPLIVPSRPNAIRMLIESELGKFGLRPKISIEIDGIGAILDLVAGGFGYAVLSQNAVTTLAGKQALRLQPLKKPRLHVRLVLAMNSHRQATATQRALIEILRAVVSQELNQAVKPTSRKSKASVQRRA